MTIEDPSLSADGYQLLPLATSHQVGDNNVGDNDIFRGALFIYLLLLLLVTIDDPSLRAYGY